MFDNNLIRHVHGWHDGLKDALCASLAVVTSPNTCKLTREALVSTHDAVCNGYDSHG
jgi:hypothetical protein